MRPLGFRYWWRLSFVSIHASVKDATKALDFDRIYIRVSIHASVKDATKLTKTVNAYLLFQSTHL